MDNKFNRQNPPRASRILRHHQCRRLTEHGRIATYDLVSVRTIAYVTEPASTFGKADITEHALNGEYFAWFAHHRRLNIVWERRDIVDHREDLYTIVDLLQRERARNWPGCQLN